MTDPSGTKAELGADSESKFRTLFESANDAIFLMDQDIFLDCNPMTLKMFGCSKEQIIGQPPCRFSPKVQPNGDKSAVKSREKIAAALSGHAQFFEWKHCRYDGTLFDAEVSLSSLRTAGKDYLQAIVRDITDRKRAEEALRDSEAKYRNILASIEDGYYEVDLAGNFTFFNPAMCSILGYTPEEIMGMNNRVFMDRENAKKVFRAFNEIYVTGIPTKGFEWEVIQKDGLRRNIDVSVSLMKTTGGKPAGFQGIARDITDRKRAEDELKQAKEKFRMLVEGINDVIFEVDGQGVILYFSPTGKNAWGYDPEDVIGRNFIELVHPDDQDILIKRFLELAAGMEYPLTYRIKTKSDNFRWARTKTKPRIENGVFMGGSGILTDITDQKLAEEALISSEEKYRQLVENINQGIFVSQDGMLRFVNPMCTKISGYSEGELTTRPFIDLIHPDDREPVFERHLRRMKGEDVPSRYEFRIVAKDGSTKWVEVDSVVIQWDGKTASLSFLNDIADRKLLESQLLQSQKMEAMGTLAGGIAHDFNNILGAMIGYTELAMDEPTERERHQDLEQVLRSCDRAKDLVNQILAFSRKSDVEKKPINIKPLVKESIQLLRAAVPTTIGIVHRIASPPMTALVNPTQIHQVIMNICTNAIHAMRETGGVLEINLAPFHITSNFSLTESDLPPGPYLKLEIKDTGRGIEPVIINRIFDPFFTTKDVSEGTGLGLSVVYGIVKSHQGDITVQSTPGSGSTFTVYLPMISSQQGKKAADLEALPRGHEHVLIVDDEQTLATLGRNMLRKLGYTVSEVTDSIQALEMFKNSPAIYDLVITDMTMPQMTGLELAVAILAIRPETLVILCTGHSELIDEERALNAGVKRLLFKPLGFRELAGAVRDVLEK